MKMYAAIQSAKPEVHIEHAGRVIAFSASVFTRRSFEGTFDVFENINRFWGKLPYKQQQEIFDVYDQVYIGIDQIRKSKDLHEFLNEQVKAVIKHHPLDRLEDFLALETSIHIPTTCKEEYFDDVNDNNTRDKTYTAKDYKRLLAFALFLRTLIPIWGEYISSTRKDTGMEYKEYVALQLLTGTGILESEAARKLQVYIDQITREKHYNLEKILNGVSSEDMGFLLFALVCVRKLCVGDLRAEDDKSHLVALVYKYLYQKVFNPSEAGSMVQEKRFTEAGSSSDQKKRSIMESYKKRTELSKGEVQEFEFAMSDLYGTAFRLAPTITKEEVDSALESAHEYRHERLGKPQLDLMAWTFKTVFSPRSLQYVSKNANFRQLAVLEAVLWNWGHKYLSILATSHMVIGRDEIHITSIDSRGQISIDLQAEIFKYYPYTWSSFKRSTQATTQETHPVLQDIDLMVDEFAKNSWRSTARESKLIEVFGDTRRRLPIFSTIKNDLARLIVDVENRR
jgi:hypothetical protein